MTNQNQVRAEEIQYLFLEEIALPSVAKLEEIQSLINSERIAFGMDYYINPNKAKIFAINGGTAFGPNYRSVTIGYFIVVDKAHAYEKILDMILYKEYRMHGFGTMAYNMISNIYGAFGIELYMWCDDNNTSGIIFWNKVSSVISTDGDYNKTLFMDQNFNKTKYFQEYL